MENEFYKIEEYLLRELDESETRNFEAALAQNPELREETERQRQMLARFQASKLRDKVKQNVILARKEEAAAAKPMIFSVNTRQVLAMAASLLLVASAVYFIFRPGKNTPPEFAEKTPTEKPAENAPQQQNQPQVVQNQPERPAPQPENEPIFEKPKQRDAFGSNPKGQIALAERFYSSPASGTFIRGDNENEGEKTPLTKASEAFENAEFARAAAILSEDSVLGDDENARFLRAHARFKSRNFAGAAADFKLLENSFQYRNDARWNLLLSEIAAGNAEKPAVKSLLETLGTDPDFPFQKQAVQLKTKLGEAKI